MKSRLSHNLRLATPMLIFTAAIGVVSRVVAEGSWLIYSDQRTASAFLATVGDGVDVFYQRFGVLGPLMYRISQESSMLTIVAVGATIISLLAVILHFLKAVRGSGDTAGFLVNLLDRVRLVSVGSHHWGVARNIEDRRPLPFARISLVGSDNAVITKTVADGRGRFGFKIPLKQAFLNGWSLEASKSGHYFPPVMRQAPSLAGYVGGALTKTATASPESLDVLLESKGFHTGHREAAKAIRIAGTAAFWVSIVAVPLASVVSPNSISALLWGGLGVALLARLGGLGRD